MSQPATFEEKALPLLEQHFGHSRFRAKQAEIIQCALRSEHTLVLMPTGMGKSLCYQLPALLGASLVLVISPLIALMKDQVDGLKKRGLQAACIHSGLARKEREQLYSGLRDGQHDLLFVTPERFRKAEFLNALKDRTIGLLAIDEAHCISEWGHDFRPDYTRLKEIRDALGNPTTMALTATATPEVQEDIIRQLDLEPTTVVRFHEGVERPNLRPSVHLVLGERDKLDQIIDANKQSRGSTIVYFALIRTLERFSELLDLKRIPHITYHGKLSARERSRLQEDFMRGKQPLVLATNAFGLGVDKADIGLIVHAEIPGSLEAYVQEIGRAGRDGLPADCNLLYDQDDLLIQMDFANWSNPGADFYEKLFRLLCDRLEEINANGIEFLREEMVYGGRFDFRVDTALKLFDRHGVTVGNLDCGRLSLRVKALPEALTDESLLDEKKKTDLLRLQKMVEYARIESCRKTFLHDHFGFPDTADCDHCDNCTP
jgi:ATP-dependent DNA helicase RecQ